eukprot:TRINITY_DN16826_c0_g2_i1.p1 TRINITY_DN16826_c0_g2~~TRINITY_DN16826_c0_g2_i1.p1  ORF type:complete len:170 (+),score=47.52 TRINITY_DN16826_c0_g2_i1:202-711(+)
MQAYAMVNDMFVETIATTLPDLRMAAFMVVGFVVLSLLVHMPLLQRPKKLGKGKKQLEAAVDDHSPLQVLEVISQEICTSDSASSAAGEALDFGARSEDDSPSEAGSTSDLSRACHLVSLRAKMDSAKDPPLTPSTDLSDDECDLSDEEEMTEFATAPFSSLMTFRLDD